MKAHFNYNFIEKTIIDSNAAIEKANKGKNPEYTELSGMLSAHPDFTVRVKDIQKKEGKKTYRKLTFDKMEEYIRTQFADKKTLNEKLVEFKAIQKVAEAKGAKYPLTKKWFLATYPSFKENEVSEQEKDSASEAERKALADAAALLDALGDDIENEAEDYEDVA